MEVTKMLVFAFVALSCSALEELPKLVEICRKEKTEKLDCLVNFAEKIRNYLATGVPEYDIPSIEPLVIEELILEMAEGAYLCITELKVWGCSNFELKDATFDSKKQTYFIDLQLPSLKVEAVYNVSGKLLLLPVKGSGVVQANFENCTTHLVLQENLYQENQTTYLNFTDLKLKVEIENGHINTPDIFKDNKFLGELMNESINRNLKKLLQEIMPAIEEKVAEFFLRVTNKIVGHFKLE